MVVRFSLFENFEAELVTFNVSFPSDINITAVAVSGGLLPYAQETASELLAAAQSASRSMQVTLVNMTSPIGGPTVGGSVTTTFFIPPVDAETGVPALEASSSSFTGGTTIQLTGGSVAYRNLGKLDHVEVLVAPDSTASNWEAVNSWFTGWSPGSPSVFTELTGTFQFSFTEYLLFQDVTAELSLPSGWVVNTSALGSSISCWGTMPSDVSSYPFVFGDTVTSSIPPYNDGVLNTSIVLTFNVSKALGGALGVVPTAATLELNNSWCQVRASSVPPLCVCRQAYLPPFVQPLHVSSSLPSSPPFPSPDVSQCQCGAHGRVRRAPGPRRLPLLLPHHGLYSMRSTSSSVSVYCCRCAW
jgi:hypothetical protein